ncbi:transcriptional regulator [Natrarchaeobius halalkaliphilus]|uniref:Transcriptional regulator n=1 Tax=Natrarchaeobius halalkaliphilus TaxID=1679091 RepID=A0A3N6MG18_9EURY|nr:transcriptional regulator [Natrarchaeobius halalkaliphilus]RQG92866.1 transcriptional regulator [Natrarchaeobius halalkaliphilus]
MREADETTRQRLADALRSEPATPSELAADFELTSGAVIDHVHHVARSIDAGDDRFLVAPPTCRDCGFDDFDDLLNRPSRCPSCKSESIAEPTFAID